jgi:hypothetical protein
MLYQPPPSQATSEQPAADPSAADPFAAPVLVELQSIRRGIRAGEPKGVLADRLRDVTLTLSDEEAAQLTRIAMKQGWKQIVAGLKRPLTASATTTSCAR